MTMKNEGGSFWASVIVSGVVAGAASQLVGHLLTKDWSKKKPCSCKLPPVGEKETVKE